MVTRRFLLPKTGWMAPSWQPYRTSAFYHFCSLPFPIYNLLTLQFFDNSSQLPKQEMVNIPVPFITCDPVSLSEKQKSNRLPVVVSGKRKTQENLIFHNNFIQCSYRQILNFCAAFWRENSCICCNYMLCFTSFYAMLSLEISKCLWPWRWRSESFVLRAFQNLNGVI